MASTIGINSKGMSLSGTNALLLGRCPCIGDGERPVE